MRYLAAVSFLFLFSYPQHCLAQNHQWSRGFANSTPQGGNVTGRGIKTDASGNIYTVGSFTSWADFDPGAGVVNRGSQGNNDIFLTKYNASGNFIYAITMGGTGDDWAYCVTVDAIGNVYIAGGFNGTVDFDPGAGVVNLISIGNAAQFSVPQGLYPIATALRPWQWGKVPAGLVPDYI